VETATPVPPTSVTETDAATVLCLSGSEKLIRITGCTFTPYTTLSNEILFTVASFNTGFFTAGGTGGGSLLLLQAIKKSTVTAAIHWYFQL
jgi:hypothetical protein